MGTFDETAVARFYHRDVVGHHRKQTLTFDDDVAHRLATDHRATPICDIKDISAEEDRFAIRFMFTRAPHSAQVGSQAPGIHLGDLYHLRDGKIS
jgi:hypothetical protein